MRLLHTETLEQSEFFGEQIPVYCILSHTWGPEEITLQELQNRKNTHKAGWDKVRSFVAFAAARRYEWCWIDTCCIDKTSSADLSESINSMFNWYRDAEICFVHLADVNPWLSKTTTTNSEHNVQATFPRQDFQCSRWFTRSWTLQELLAPEQLVFVSGDWTYILGDKASLCDEISIITGIPRDIVKWYPGSTVTLSGDVGYRILVRKVSCASVAQVMSWAADRSATREEDMAYSLLGLFGLEMPLLYGEGKKAFIRLQQEILKFSTDQSLFAWKDHSLHTLQSCGLFASCPSMFRGCDFVPTFNHMPNNKEMTSMMQGLSQTVSQRGLQFEGIVSSVPDHVSQRFIRPETKILRLQCVRSGNADMQDLEYWWVSVFVDYDAGLMSYVRSQPDVLIDGLDHKAVRGWNWQKETLNFPRGIIHVQKRRPKVNVSDANVASVGWSLQKV